MKRLLALALALVMIFCLAACGEDKKSDDKDSSTTAGTTTTPTTPNKPNDPEPGNGTKVGLSIADLDALLQPLLNGDAGTDVENLYLEMGASEEALLLALGAKLLGENVDANLFVGQDIVLSAPALLDKNYGISMENLVSLIESAMSSAGAVMPSIDPEAVLELVGKYYTLLIEEIVTADGITAEEDALGTITITGELDSDAVAQIVVNIIETACADEDFFALMGSMSGMSPDEFKNEFLAGKPSKDELLSQLQQMLAAYELKITVTNLELQGGAFPVAADLTVSLNQDLEGGNRPAIIDVAYDLLAGTCDISFLDEGTEIFSLTIGDGELDLVVNAADVNIHANVTISDTGLVAYVEQNGQKLGELVLNVTDNGLNGYLNVNGQKFAEFELRITENGFYAGVTSNGETMSVELAFTDSSITLTLNLNRSVMVLNAKITETGAEGSLTMDGMEMGKIVFVKSVEGSKTAYTLTTLAIQGTEIDFSEGGLSFYIDTNAQIPATPEYTDISTLTNAEMEAILEKFATDNADLIEMFSALFGSMGGSAEGEFSVKVDTAA